MNGECATCGQGFKEGEKVQEVRLISTKRATGEVSTDRSPYLVHLVCPLPKDEAQIAREWIEDLHGPWDKSQERYQDGTKAADGLREWFQHKEWNTDVLEAPEGVMVMTKSPGGMEQALQRQGSFWFDESATMHVYYTPVAWKPL